MAFIIQNSTSLVFEVPRESSEWHLDELRRRFASELSIRNEIPEVHQLTMEWNEGAIESAKKEVLAILRSWEGERPQQFIIVFTNSSGDRLIEIVSAIYLIENGKVEMGVTECLSELYEVLTGPDIRELLSSLREKQQSNSPPDVVVRSKPLTINAVIRSMNFKNFENNLDGPPTICRYDISQRSLPQAMCSTASIIQKMLLVQKEDQGPYKFSFTLPQMGKITVRTARMQGFVNFKCKNFGGMKEGVGVILKTIEQEQFKILNLNITGYTVKLPQ